MKNKEWTISSNSSLLELNFGELLTYKFLFRQLIYRDFVASYKQTLLGPAWFVIHPILSAGIFTIIFGRIIKISTDQIPQPIFYLTGITAWNYFSECLSRTSSVFRDNANMFGKVYFPRIIVPICTAISLSFRLGIQLTIILIVLGIYRFLGYKIQLSAVALALPLLILLTAMQGIGIGLIIGSLTVNYRDFNFLIVFGLQLIMYTTTVLFPLSSVPDDISFIVQSNPMTTIIEAFRFTLLGSGYFSWTNIVACSLFSLLIFLTGVTIFNKVQRNFVDII